MKALKNDDEYTMDVLALAEEISRIARHQHKAVVIAAYPESLEEYAFADCRFGLKKFHKGRDEKWYQI